MKPITKKVIEAGLVSKHTLMLMQRWGYLDPEATELNNAIEISDGLTNGFVKFVEELDELLMEEEDEEIKETRFSMTLRDPMLVAWDFDLEMGVEIKDMVIFRDEFNNLIFPSSSVPHIGYKFKILDSDNLKEIGKWFEITRLTTLWAASCPIAHQVEAIPL